MSPRRRKSRDYHILPIAWWSSFASFSGYWSMMKHDGTACWIKKGTVCRHVSTCRQAGLIVWGLATSCYQVLLPAATSCLPATSPGEVMWREHSDDHPPHCSQHLRSPGISGITRSTDCVCWGRHARLLQAVASSGTRLSNLFISVQAGIIEIGKPWNTSIFMR